MDFGTLRTSKTESFHSSPCKWCVRRASAEKLAGSLLQNLLGLECTRDKTIGAQWLLAPEPCPDALQLQKFPLPPVPFPSLRHLAVSPKKPESSLFDDLLLASAHWQPQRV